MQIYGHSKLQGCNTSMDSNVFFKSKNCQNFDYKINKYTKQTEHCTHWIKHVNIENSVCWVEMTSVIQPVETMTTIFC